MAVLNSTDILVRRQLLACFIGNFGSRVINDELVGKECWEQHLQELKLLIGISKVLANYRAITSEVRAFCDLSFNAGNNGTVTVKLNNQVLGSATFSSSLTQLAIDLKTSINISTPLLALSLRFTATSNGTDVTISAPSGTGDLYNNIKLTVVYTGNITGTINNLSQGVNAVTANDNCLSETQAQHLWDEAAKLSGLCFLPIGTTYINFADTIPISGRLTEDNNSRITEEGNQRIL